MAQIPSYVSWTFIAIVAAVLAFLIYGIHSANPGKKNLTTSIVLTLLVGWLFLVCVLTFSGFFSDYSMPPRLMLFTAIPMAFIILLLSLPASRKFLMEVPITTLHYLHIVRVPVEMVLWWLSVWMVIPEILTFEGVNLDIISGISAPFAAVFMVGSRSQNRIGAVIWNLLALALLANIVTMAIKHTPYFFEATATTPANTAVFYFPYVLLPTFVVPAVFFCHAVSLVQLIFKKDQRQF